MTPGIVTSAMGERPPDDELGFTRAFPMYVLPVAEVLALAVAVQEACKLPPLPELPDRPPPFTCNGCLALIASGGAEPREGTKASPRLSCDFVVRELCEQAAEWRAAQPAPPNPE